MHVTYEQAARLGMLFMPDINMHKMLGNEKLMPALPDYYNIFTDESLPVKAAANPMELNVEEMLESYPVALLIPW